MSENTRLTREASERACGASPNEAVGELSGVEERSDEHGWHADVLPGYSARRLALPVPPEQGEPDESLCATLVRKDGVRHRRAVLHIHGWNDYFFQTHVADYFVEHGFSFYALDLRRYGRSLREGQFAGYVDDLDDYGIEFDMAAAIIALEHDELVVMAHSTGGLAAALWADGSPGVLSGLILNSPWLDMQGGWLVRSLAAPIVSRLGSYAPTAVMPLPNTILYAKSTHVKYGGEWDYDLSLKTELPMPVRAGWVAAVTRGQERVAAGLHIDCPVLVLSAGRSEFRARWAPSMKTADSVLDVEQIAARSIKLGDVVTMVKIPDAMHDVTLSLPPVRRHLWSELSRWLNAYVPVLVASLLNTTQSARPPEPVPGPSPLSARAPLGREQ